MANNKEILTSELDNDPEAFGYAAAGWTNSPPSTPEYQAVADLINAAGQSEIVDISLEDFDGAIEPDEWPSGQPERDYLALLKSSGIIKTTRPNVRSGLTDGTDGVFTSGTTRSNLLALWTDNKSRAAELGLPQVQIPHLKTIKGDTS